MVRNIVLFGVLIYELVGPALTRIALTGPEISSRRPRRSFRRTTERVPESPEKRQKKTGCRCSPFLVIILFLMRLKVPLDCVKGFVAQVVLDFACVVQGGFLRDAGRISNWLRMVWRS